jgi:hypothetical protein
MRNALFLGILGGLAAGIVIGLLLSAVTASDMHLSHDSLMQNLAHAIGARHLATAWAVTLAGGVVLGAIFGGLMRRPREAGRVSSWTLLFAVTVWIVVSAVVGPLLIGAPPVLGLRHIVRLWPFVVGGLMLSLSFWSILAFVFLSLRGQPRTAAGEARTFRQAA